MWSCTVDLLYDLLREIFLPGEAHVFRWASMWETACMRTWLTERQTDVQRWQKGSESWSSCCWTNSERREKSPSSVYSASSLIPLSSPLFLPPPHPCPAFLSFPQPLPFHFSLPVPLAMPGDIKQTQSVSRPSLTLTLSLSLSLSLPLSHIRTHQLLSYCRPKAVCAQGYSTMCARARTASACACALWRTYWRWRRAKPVSDHRKVSLSVSVWPFEGTVKVIEEASLWFRHCVNYKSQSCRVWRAEGREMFSESVKGLLKSLTNTLVFITVVTSPIFLFFCLPPSLYWSHVQSHMQVVILWVERSSRFTMQITINR